MKEKRQKEKTAARLAMDEPIGIPITDFTEARESSVNDKLNLGQMLRIRQGQTSFLFLLISKEN
jgi:hypothetical protein